MKYIPAGVVLMCCLACSVPQKTAVTCTTCKATVVVFIALDCPISQKYIGRLNELAEKYGKDVEITAKVPQEVSQKDVEAFVEEYRVAFNMRVDRGQVMTTALGARITPEVFLFNPAGELQYRGAIDNWFYALGRSRQETTELYLSDAISRLLQGKAPDTKQTEAIGCIIQRKRKAAH